jgi:type IV fimbrial biogenesis protein FimT
MVTIAVASIIMSVGVPGFMSFIQNSRATTHSNDIITAMNFARSEATRRGGTITVCSSSDGVACNGGNDWSNGWIVRDPAGAVLRTWPERSGGAGVVAANVAQIQFQARGSITPGAAPQLQIRTPHCTGNQGRNVNVNIAGRISVNRVGC